ncbi:MAG: glycosyltransferase [Flavobacterium sp.]|nr:MAG: glycosyltransferase [Flavobacterium sp.]
MDTGITVLICTYNGAERLPKTIEYLAQQKVEAGFDWEVILVDNASTDFTAEIAKAEWAKHQRTAVKFNVFIENEPGKINALYLGFSKAKYEFSVICDDDNWLDPHYIQNVFNILNSNSSIGAVGGQSIATSDSGKLPYWFQQYEEGYAVGRQGEISGDVTDRGHLWGAGMGTRTTLYIEMYQNVPSLLIGRSGNKLTAGEDSEYCLRLILKGYRLYFDSKLTFIHYMPNERLTDQYRIRLFKGLSESNDTLEKYHLAIRTMIKYNKNAFSRFRLLLATRLRILFSHSLNQKEMDTLTLISDNTRDSDSVASKIKAFISS